VGVSRSDFRFTWLLLAILAILSSCRVQDVLIIDDPYRNLLTEDRPFPDGRGFVLRARLRGFRVRRVVNNGDMMRLSDAFVETGTPDIAVLSPWNTAFMNLAADSAFRLITVGRPARPPAGPWTALVPDRRSAVAEIGRIAGRTAVDAGVPALAYVRTEDRPAFISGFDSVADGISDRLAVFAEPSDLSMRDGDFSIVVALLGRNNPELLDTLGPLERPVITEFARHTGFSDDRIIASLEDDPRSLRRALLTVLGNEGENGVYVYPQRVLKK